MTKAERLDFGESLMTHAMVLTGVDIVDGQTTKWKVENSWGEKVGENGFFVMSDAWMDEYTYQIVVHKDLLTDEQKSLGTSANCFGTLGSNGSISITEEGPAVMAGPSLGGELHGFRPMLYNHCLLNEQSVGVFQVKCTDVLHQNG